MSTPLLMIPGPVRLSERVSAALAQPAMSHTSPEFIALFGESLEMMRKIFLSERGQPMLVSGSGTLAMELAVQNLVEPGDRILVASSGYFSDRFKPLVERGGVTVDILPSKPGEQPDVDAAREKLRTGKYKLMTLTQVDTSTGVCADVKAFARLAREFDVLFVVDSVCGLAGMELHHDEWDIDVTLTGSQKALASPAGLALLMIGPRALAAFERRSTPVQSYYADWANWLPIMRAYEERRPAYFATPAVNLVAALHTSLQEILSEGLDARWKRHRTISDHFKERLESLRLKPVPTQRSHAATTMSAYYFPEGTDASMLARIRASGVTLAGGIHQEIRDRYFRVGHMGNVNEQEIQQTCDAISKAL